MGSQYREANMHPNAARDTIITSGTRTDAAHVQDLAPLQMVTMRVKRRKTERTKTMRKIRVRIMMTGLVAEADPVVGEDIAGQPTGDAVVVLQGQGRMREKIIQEVTAQGKNENPGKREMKVSVRDHLVAVDADPAQDDPAHQRGKTMRTKSRRSKKNRGMGKQRAPPRRNEDQRFE